MTQHHRNLLCLLAARRRRAMQIDAHLSELLVKVICGNPEAMEEAEQLLGFTRPRARDGPVYTGQRYITLPALGATSR